MELKQLEFFMAACQCGSLGKAAAMLYTTQPNVSRVIHQLEQELGQPLFERTSKGLRLTPFGKRTHHYADAILKNAAALQQDRPEERQTTFAFSAYRSNLLAWLLVGLRQEYPDLIIWHRQGTMEEITNQVAQGLSELGMVYISRKQLKIFRHILRHKQLEFVSLAEREVCIYTGPHSPYYNRSAVTLEEVSTLSLVQEFSDFFSMEHHFEQVDLGAVRPESFRPAIYTNSDHLTTALLSATDVCELGMDLPHAHDQQFGIHNLRIEGNLDPLVLGYVAEKGRILSEVGQRFVQMIQETLENHRPS